MGATENPRIGLGDLVVVGSSAGGIEALSILVSSLASDFPAPIVLAQHLDPNRPSSLAAILERRSSLPIVIVSRHTPLESGKIYVVPSNRHVTIKDGHLELEEDHAERPRPSVDLLLSSAAAAYGERLIAVILTGSGSDGANGAVDVKNAGGTVIIQNPQTAHYPSMPMALPPTSVDYVADIEGVGQLLYDVVKGVLLREPKEKTEDALRNLLSLVKRQANLDFQPYKPSTILRRIARRMAVTHNQTLQDYEAYLEAHPEEIGDLLMAFLIKVTEFFRDAGAFTYLRDQILPHLIERGRENGHVLRFWSAGCATGEEPYSLALLLAELLGKELPEWSIKIFATDIDEGAISFARRGLYPRNILGNMPDEYRQRFFEPVDQGYRIVKSLRQMVIFGQQDLSRGAPFPRIDLVVCRNLLIYFKPELQQHVLDLFAYSLHQVNGYLFLGKAETARPSKAIFDLIDKRFKLYRCVNGSIPIPSRHAMNPTEGSLPERHRGRRPSQNDKPLADHDLAMAALEIAPLRWFNEQVLRFVPIGVVVIDRAYRIVTINSVARRYLGIRDAGHEQDFLHSVRGLPYAQVRNTIDSVFRERSTVTLPEIELDPAAGGNGRLLMFTIALLQPEAGMPEMALVSVSDGTEQLQTRRRLEAVQAEQKQLVDELSAANRRLTDMNQELQDANEELETTNEELTARSTELQGLAHVLEGERVRLAEMVELAPFHIIVLRGRNLIVEAFNPHYSRLLDGREAQGRPLDEVIEYFWGGGSEIVDLIRAAYQEDLPRVTPRMAAALPDEPEEPVERYFVYTIVPTHDAAGQVDGVVVYAEDMTEQRARDAEGQREQLRLIFDHTRQIALALYDAETLGLLMASPRYLEGAARAHSANPHDLIGRKLPDLDWFVSGDVAAELWDEVLRSRAKLRRPEVHIQLDPHQPETVWDWFLTPIMDTEQPDRVRYMLVSAVEITEQAQ